MDVRTLELEPGLFYINCPRHRIQLVTESAVSYAHPGVARLLKNMGLHRLLIGNEVMFAECPKCLSSHSVKIT